MARSKLPRNLSGRDVVKVLCNKFGFTVSRRRGSHVVLVKREEGKKIVTVVPLHEELAIGTLRGVLELAGIDVDEFLKYV